MTFLKNKGMKYIPILMSTAMVQAIMEGRKTMTRTLKGLNFINEDFLNWKYIAHGGFFGASYVFVAHEEMTSIACPYSIGDILWVREAFVPDYFDDHSPGYKADWNKTAAEYVSEPKWKPSVCMLKEACRIFLKVTGVRCERLHEITELDAVAEGIFDMLAGLNDGTPAYQNYMHTKKEAMADPGGHWGIVADDAIHSFQTLWSKINGQSSWDANPYVWVVSFERCERPVDFLDNKIK